MKSVAELIETLGGHRRVADALRVPTGTVSSWKSRGAIPARAWTGLVTQARKDRVPGVTLQTLADLHSAPNHETPRAESADKEEKVSRRVRVKVRIDKDLLAEAANLGIEINALADEILREAIKNEKNRRWQAEHADVIAWYNEHIERDGIFGEEWRTF